MSYKKQELLTLCEHLGSPLVLMGSVLVIFSVLKILMFTRTEFSIMTFYFSLSISCADIYNNIYLKAILCLAIL